MKHKKKKGVRKWISIINISVNGAASRPALLQCRAMGSTTDIQLLNSLYRIAKYVGFDAV